MLSQELRPSTWSEVAGQKENIKILKAIVRNPIESPKCLIFQGAFGSGKTTCSRIMARELNNIKDPNFDLLSSPFYYEFDSTVVGNVEEIRRLGDTFKMNYGDYWRVIVFDECMSYDTKILLADGSYMKIGEIVNKKLDVEVMSYNEKTGKTEPKKVTGWFKNSPKKFYKVKTTKQKGYLECSDNHRFITPKGEIQLKDLSVGDEIYRIEPSISDEQMGFLVGTLLGDSSISFKDSEQYCPRFTLTQGEAQKDWLGLKVHLLRNLLPTEELYSNDNFGTYEKSFDNSHRVYERRSRSLICLRELSRLVWVNNRKTVTRELLNKLTPAGIAAWYLDDGQRCDRVYKGEKIPWRVKLHTSGYTEEEQDIIIEYFRDVWGILFRKKKYAYWYLITDSKDDAKKFYDIISNEIPEGIMEYKIPKDFELGGNMMNIPIGKDITIDKITSIELVSDKLADSYDIEVEDNHNYFAGGILVHNCHAVSTAAQTALLKILEEAEGRNIFILCTTHIHKVLPTIRSRSLELTFECVPEDEIIDNLTKVAKDRELDLSDEIKLLIADRSGGHMRNAHMLLDKYNLLGEEDFKDSIKSSISLYCDFLIAVYNNDKDGVLKNINELMNIPRDDLNSDFNMVMMESMRGYCGFDVRHVDIRRLVDTYKEDFSIIVNCYMSAWMKNAFIDMPYFQATFLNIYNTVRNALNQKEARQSMSANRTPINRNMNLR